jgi:hypothetical protein
VAVAALSPVEELEELEEAFGTRQAVADVLGKQRPQVARWLIDRPAIQGRHRQLINDSWVVVKFLRSQGVDDADALRNALLGRSPELDFRRPVELIWEGAVETVLKTLGGKAGQQLAEDARVIAVSGPAAAVWKSEFQRELDESLRARSEDAPLHETFVFLAALDVDERDAFAAAATQALGEATSEEDFHAFLEPYWRHLAASHPQTPVATIEPAPEDEQSSSEAFSIDDLLIPDGGMSSRRFARR